MGCTVIGYAGTDDKVDWLKNLGFDHAFNYKKVSVKDSLAQAAPNGVDCYFDNVGGEMSISVMEAMNKFGRVSVCGAISQYAKAKNNSRCSLPPIWPEPQLTPWCLWNAWKHSLLWILGDLPAQGWGNSGGLRSCYGWLGGCWKGKSSETIM